jgi:hypothetical protein
MRTLTKTVVALLIAGTSVASLAGCAGQGLDESQNQPGSSALNDRANIFVDGEVAAGKISDALEAGRTLSDIRKDLPGYLENRAASNEDANLTAGSCGLHGTKDFTLTVGNDSYLYVYTSRTGKSADSSIDGRTALISKACGIYG